MMDIKVLFLSFIEDLVGKKEVIINLEDNSNLNDLLNTLKNDFTRELYNTIFSPSGKIKKYILVGLNGENVKNYAVELSPGDEISLLPAIAGG